MTDLRPTDSLSFGDAVFLHLERQGSPLHVASVCLFDGAIPFEDFVGYVESKLPLIPRYLQRVIPPPFGLGVPTLEYDADFDIRSHVLEIKLKHGTDAELKTAVARIVSEVLDRQRPLWEFTLLSGLKGNRTALLVRMHHCLADGISGVGLLNTIMDTTPFPSPAASRKATPPPPPRPRDQATLLFDGVVSTWFSAVDRVLTAQSEVLKLAQQLTSAATSANRAASNGSSGMSTANGFGQFLPEFGSPTDRLPFNVVCRGPQKFLWAEIPFDEIRTVKRECGTTVNDVVLTVVAAAVGRYARLHKIATEKRVLRVVVPVNVRASAAENAELGNQITFLPITIPLGIRKPRQLLMAVHERMQALKAMRVAELVGVAGTMIGTIPTALQALVGPLASQLPISVCNLICTNVPGPQAPLYMLGRKMTSFYPYVPIGGEMGMNCAVVTYDGTAFFGFTGDVNAIPDLHRLPEFLNASFDELRKSIKVRIPRPKAAKARKPKRKVQTGKIDTKEVDTEKMVAPLASDTTVGEIVTDEVEEPIALTVGV